MSSQCIVNRLGFARFCDPKQNLTFFFFLTDSVVNSSNSLVNIYIKQSKDCYKTVQCNTENVWTHGHYVLVNTRNIVTFPSAGENKENFFGL